MSQSLTNSNCLSHIHNNNIIERHIYIQFLYDPFFSLTHNCSRCITTICLLSTPNGVYSFTRLKAMLRDTVVNNALSLALRPVFDSTRLRSTILSISSYSSSSLTSSLSRIPLASGGAVTRYPFI